MGTLFEELLRCFNEGIKEKALEHRTQRDVVRLKTTLMIRLIAAQVKRGSDAVCKEQARHRT